VKIIIDNHTTWLSEESAVYFVNRCVSQHHANERESGCIEFTLHGGQTIDVSWHTNKASRTYRIGEVSR